MKVRIAYFEHVTKEFEFDDKFAPAISEGAENILWDSFLEEVHKKLSKISDYEEIDEIENLDNGDYVYF